MMEYSIVLRNITKQYYLEKPRTLKKWFSNLFHPFKKFIIINNFSLCVKKGDFIIIKGPNGSGKSTILKIISGITSPDKGTVYTKGRVVPLIELGAGFNFELTGRENIVIYATILGIEMNKIQKIIPKIIRFSGLQDFIDVPIKRYSSGMISRLAFSIAIYSNPDVLLLDEIFSIGDKSFRKKSIAKIKEFNKKGVTIILVTHFAENLPQLKPTKIITLRPDKPLS